MRSVSTNGIEWRHAFFIGDDEIATGLMRLINTVPTLKFSICADQHLVNASGKMSFDLRAERCGLFATDGLAPAKFAQQVLSCCSIKHSTARYPLFTPIAWVVAFSRTLLISEYGFDRRIDIQADAVIGYIANLPDSITLQGHQMQQCVGLVDAYTIDIAP